MIGEIKELFIELYKHYPTIKEFTLLFKEYFNNQYFYNQSLIENFIYRFDTTKLPKNKYVNYQLYLDDEYYKDDKTTVELLRNNDIKQIQLPYKTVVNFIHNKNQKILIGDNLTEYYIEDNPNLMKVTDNNFKEFNESKNKGITNGIVLRVSDFVEKDNQYFIYLQKSNYFSQVRTNLTLDNILDIQDESIELANGKKLLYNTLRLNDMNENNSLEPFNKSLLINSIGVSSVIYYNYNGEKYFFMKKRNNSTGVFENQYGTVSGVVECYENRNIKNQNILTHIEEQLKKELLEETGITEQYIKKIIPLSFMRELSRGGKPQFFYLIEVEYIKKEDIEKKFRKSKDGLKEFSHTIIGERTNYLTSLSTEFLTNLILSYQYFQAKDRKKINPIKLNKL